MKKFLIKFLLFSIIFITIAGLLGPVLSQYRESIQRWQYFYQLPKNSIDILFMGSSHSYATFNPKIFNAKLGINSYNLSSNSQNIIQTYFNFKEVLKRQKPKLVVIEAFSIDDNNNWNRGIDWKKDANFDGMKFSLNKLQALVEQYKPAYYIHALFPALRNHSNWKNGELIKENIDRLFHGKRLENYYGFTELQTHMSLETMEKYRKMKGSAEDFKIHPNQLKYIKKLVNLAEENNIEVLLVMAPMYKEYNKKVNYESRHRKIKEIAEQYHIPFIDYNLLYDELGLSERAFEDSFTNYHHTNYFGAIGVSNHLVDYMEENYKDILPDRREDTLWLGEHGRYLEYYIYNDIREYPMKVVTDKSYPLYDGLSLEKLSVFYQRDSYLFIFQLAFEDHRRMEQYHMGFYATPSMAERDKVPQESKELGFYNWNFSTDRYWAAGDRIYLMREVPRDVETFDKFEIFLYREEENAQGVRIYPRYGQRIILRNISLHPNIE